ncbi:hypothetical protein L873DRAFT_1801681 [Choiromyces venosus 120613-1]|uniref:Uncharacterized protein n=1 Tax=Choiromyces venosus 120613-1 TaxID=1336337 RepID=A0A3N4K9S1_9PEZI|nr:hypothetical protein L873DRAFT_1801681 [Choiromyces venosus 120613-1]
MRLGKLQESMTDSIRQAAAEVHKDHLSHVTTTGITTTLIPFGIVFRWWIDYQCKLLSSDQEKTTPIVQALIDQAYISKTKWAEGLGNQRWIQEDKMAFDSIKAVVFKKQSRHFWHDKSEVPLLDAVFAVCQDPTITQEENLASITGKSLPQVGMYCKFPLSRVSRSTDS